MPSALFGITLFVFANALYVAAEFGAVGVRRSRVRRMAEDGNWLAQRLLPYIETPAALDRYVGASQIGITLSSLMLGAFAQATITRPLRAHARHRGSRSTRHAPSRRHPLIVLVVLTAFQLILGELVPKALALQYPTETALATVLPMQWSLVDVPTVPLAAERPVDRRPPDARVDGNRTGICTRPMRSSS